MTDGQAPTANGEGAQVVPEPTEPQTPDLFPREYVEKLRQEAAESRIRLKQIEDERAKADETRLIEEKKWQDLAEKRAKELDEVRPYKERLDAMLEMMAESNKKRIEQVPEAMRSLVPEYDDPAKLSQWLDANWQMLTGKPIAPNLNGAAGNPPPRTTAANLSDAEIQIAKKMGLTPDQYQTAKAQVRV